MIAQPTPRQILSLPLDHGDVTGAYATVRGYLERVLRPPGDDGWRWPVYVALAEAGMLPGVTVGSGEDGSFPSFPDEARAHADALIAAAVEALGACGPAASVSTSAVTSPAPAPAKPPAARTEPHAPVSEAAVRDALDAVPKFWKEAHAVLQAYPSAKLARVMLEAAAPRMAAERAETAEARLAEVRQTIAAFFTYHGNSAAFALQTARDLAEGIRQVLDRAPMEALEGAGAEPGS